MPTDAPGHSQATVASYDTIGVGYNETRRADGPSPRLLICSYVISARGWPSNT